jgi:hypothetical protein
VRLYQSFGRIIGKPSIDPRRCLKVLEAEPAPTGDASAELFDEATTSLMRWLTHQYFTCSESAWIQKAEPVVKRILALRRNRVAVWQAMVYRSRDACADFLAVASGKAVREFEDNLSEASSHVIFRQIRTLVWSRRASMLERKLDKLLDKLEGSKIPPVPSASPVRRMLPVVRLVSMKPSHVRVSKLPEHNSDLRLDIKARLDKSNIAHMSKEDSLLFLRVLIGSVAPSIARDFDHPAYGRPKFLTVHELSGILHGFERKLHPALAKSSGSPVEGRQFIGDIRCLVAAACEPFWIEALLRQKGWGKNVPLSIADKVRQCLSSTLMSEFRAVLTLDDALQIEGWDGPGEKLIDQLLRGLSYNVERSLALLPVHEQRCRITLESGMGREAGFAILTVEQPLPPNEGVSPSTSYSILYVCRNIQRIANSLRNGPFCGRATFHPVTGPPYSRLQVFFPLWTKLRQHQKAEEDVSHE